MAAPIGVQACACCTEPGQRLEATGALDTYGRGELERVSFASTARLFTTAAFPDDIKGIVDPSQEPYGLRGRIGEKRLLFDVTDPKGKTGQVVMPIPQRLTRFEVDPRDGSARDTGMGPPLYKEWRLEGPVRLGGILAGGGGRATARLILHGSGNSCTSADQFSQWTLSVTGPGTRFTLLGALGNPPSKPGR